jgi:alkyldihydroxyacetonephosphate synthase
VDVAARIAEALPGVRVSSSGPDRLSYSRDLWPKRLIEVRAGRAAQHQPAAIAWPRGVDDVVTIVNFARREGIRLVPFGAGSGVCGGIQPDGETLVVDMKKIADHRVDRDAPLVDVGAGAMGITLEEELGRQGYTIGHFPSSILCSTVGGWIAARGAGQCSGLYGKIEDMVVSLECVLGTGDVVRLRRRSSAPDLVPLVLGSEGTLAVVTRAELRLHPRPQARAFAAFSFSTIARGWNALRELFQSGLRPAVSRLYDPIDSRMLAQGPVKKRQRTENAVARAPKQHRRRSPLASVLGAALRIPAAVNAAIELTEGNLLGGCTLILMFEGSDATVHVDAERAAGICAREGGAWLGEGPARAWLEHRYGVSYRQSPVFRLGAFSDTMEVAAPWSRLERLYHDVRHALGEHVLVLAHLSHAYPDGCSIYFTFLGAGRNDDEALEIYERAWRAALGAAIEAGGTLSHHHGVGRSKAPRLGEELGAGIELVRGLMKAWDPHAILNPGNLTSREPAAARRASVALDTAQPLLLDEQSWLVDVPASLTLAEAEASLRPRGFTFALESDAPRSATIASWLAEGAPGARDPWSDPVDQLVAGLAVRLKSGEPLVIRPAPRRAVGPDLRALFLGARERLGAIERATLSVRRAGASPARALAFASERDPALSDAERAAWERVASALGDAATKFRP